MANGILIIDKPAGWTSMDVCAKLRGMFHEKRVGHAGTLDPMATGVLPVFIGRATRAVEFATESEKEYIAGLKLGVITNTQDTTGEILEERAVEVNGEQLLAVLRRFTGDIEQTPPMYSAIKINGKKLYELARKGKEVERRPRPVTIHALELLGWPDAGEDFTLRVVCSKGTYVRTLCHDIGLFCRPAHAGAEKRRRGEEAPERRCVAGGGYPGWGIPCLRCGQNFPCPWPGVEWDVQHGQELFRGVISDG